MITTCSSTLFVRSDRSGRKTTEFCCFQGFPEDKTVGFPANLVTVCEATVCHTPEDRKFHTQCSAEYEARKKRSARSAVQVALFAVTEGVVRVWDLCPYKLCAQTWIAQGLPL